MLCGPQLSPCSQQWRAGSGVARILSAGGQVAVSLLDGTLLFGQQDLGSPVSEVANGGLRCVAAACSPQGVLLLGGDGRLYRLELADGEHPSPQPLELDGGQPEAVIACITCQEGSPVFAVARGSCVHVLDEAGQQQRCIGPLPAPVTQLAWVGDTLVGATATALHTWTLSGREDGPVLPCPHPDAHFLSIAATHQAPLLAASCAGKEVRCWGVSAPLDAASGRDEPLQLCEFDSPVTCMAWSGSGQYLATVEGPICTVWDLSDASGAKRGSSIVCCGHEQRTTITAVAFQPDGPMLATASSSGKIALFDCSQFRRGGVLAPAVATQLDQAASDAVTALLWMPEGRLAVGDAGGRLVCLQLTPDPAAGAAQPSEEQQAAAALAHDLSQLQLGAGAGAVQSQELPAADSFLPAATTEDAVAAEHAGVVEEREAVSFAAVASAATLPRPDSTAQAQQQAGPSTPRSARARHDSTGVSGFEGQEESAHTIPLPEPLSLNSSSRQSSINIGGNGQPRRARGARGGASRGGGAATAAAGEGAAVPGSSGGFSRSLMHHIQAIRENPPQPGGRSDQQIPLAGWGLGSPSGAHVPWLMMGAAASPHMSAAGPAASAAAAANFSQYQAAPAMMQRMAVPQSPAGMPAGYVAAAPAASPQPSAAGIYQQQAMYAAAATAVAPGMAPQQMMMTTQWVPYMQQMQQWAGTAPGYMMYQHPQYATTAASLQSAALRHSGGHATTAAVPGYGSVPMLGMPAGGGSSLSGRMSPAGSGSSAFSPRAMANGGGPAGCGGASNAAAFPGHGRVNSNGSFGSGSGSGSTHWGGSRQLSVQAGLEAAEAADRDSNRDNNRAGSPRSRAGSQARGAASPASSRQPGSSSLPAYAADSPPDAGRELLHQLQHSGVPSPQKQGGRSSPFPASEAAAQAAQQQQEAQEEAANQQQGRDSGSASSGGQGELPSGLEAVASVDLNNADMNNRDLSSSEESGSQADTAGASGGGGSAGSVSADASVSTVYVGNLPGTVDEYMLMCAFAPFGPITHVQVIKEKGSNLSRGYGFVSYAHPIYATVAMQQMNHQVLFGPFAGQRIKVAPSKRH